jgi:hypothetical protein
MPITKWASACRQRAGAGMGCGLTSVRGYEEVTTRAGPVCAAKTSRTKPGTLTVEGTNTHPPERQQLRIDQLQNRARQCRPLQQKRQARGSCTTAARRRTRRSNTMAVMNSPYTLLYLQCRRRSPTATVHQISCTFMRVRASVWIRIRKQSLSAAASPYYR